MKKLTPILYVDKIEDCLPFWMEKLKFNKTIEVPGEDGLGFCILVRENVEVMLQTRAALEEDLPQLANGSFDCSGVMLFLETDDLDEIIAATKDCEIVAPERTTFYGMRELGVRAPGGCVVVFAQTVAEEAAS